MNISISRQDTALLKGLAIIAIVLHNFAHWIPGAVVENEYNFYVSHSLDLLTVLSHGGPHIILNDAIDDEYFANAEDEDRIISTEEWIEQEKEKTRLRHAGEHYK